MSGAMNEVAAWPWPPECKTLGEDAPLFRGVVLNVADDRSRALIIDQHVARCIDVSMPTGERLPSNIRIGSAGYLRLRRGHPEFEPKAERRKKAEVV